MLDIKLIRENPELVRKDLQKRRDDEKLNWLDDLINKDKEYLEILKNVEELRRKRNELTQKVAKLKKAGKDASKILDEAKKIPDEIKELEERKDQLEKINKNYLMRLPNITHETVPYGKDDSENIEVKKWGKIVKPKFDLISHGELAEKLGVADFKKSTQVTGTGFYYLMGDLALLNQALCNFAIDIMVKKGYKLIIPPLMLNRKAYEGVTDLGDFENVMYKIDSEDLYMIATSEHPIAALYMNEVIAEEDMPLKMVGYSPCFRKEIGSHGVDTRGIFRVHQFWKIEQFIFCKPEDSWKHHEELIKNSEELFQALEIPYRVVNICTGDIGTVAAKKYDLEVWMPRQNAYKEACSCSNCTDYQARRLNIKYGKRGSGDLKLIHTLNDTAIATSRALVAIIENFQNEDGSIDIPKVLWPYMNGKKKIVAQK
jgi:seryl-tRNA synthetase